MWNFVGRSIISPGDLADKMLSQAWKRIPDGVQERSGYHAFLQSVLDADQSIEAGAHAVQIKELFARTGIS